MFSYLMYYAPIALQLATAAGFVIGGPWVFVGIISFPAMALIDSLFPDDMRPRRLKSRFWANVPVWICTLLGPGLYLIAAWRIGQGDLTGFEIFGTIMSLAWMSVIPLVPAAHELYHQRGALARFVGRYSQVCYLDCTREIAHVVGHHIHVGTARDSDTARRGTTLWSFTPRAVVESTKECWRVEGDALEKRGKGRWSLGHRLYSAIAAQIIFQAIVFAIGGWAAVGVALAAMVIARFWVESFNYFQHYGIVRAEGTPIARRHLWNHLGFLSRLIGWEITNHADHHLDSYLPYYKLVPDRSAIRMPSVFMCFFTALIPPLWHNYVIKPALKRWDLEFASPEERKLARAQNLAAGWPDWFSPESEQSGSSAKGDTAVHAH